jgi:hypothetical protein
MQQKQYSDHTATRDRNRTAVLQHTAFLRGLWERKEKHLLVSPYLYACPAKIIGIQIMGVYDSSR